VVQVWPDGGTNWRSSSQIGQRCGGVSDAANCVPQVLHMKAGMMTANTKSATLKSAALDERR